MRDLLCSSFGQLQESDTCSFPWDQNPYLELFPLQCIEKIIPPMRGV